MGQPMELREPWLGHRDASFAEAFPELEYARIEYYESDLCSEKAVYSAPQLDPQIPESSEILALLEERPRRAAREMVGPRRKVEALGKQTVRRARLVPVRVAVRLRRRSRKRVPPAPSLRDSTCESSMREKSEQGPSNQNGD